MAGAILLAGCDPTFLPPDIPSHLGGEGHAEPRKSPFLCRDPSVVIVKGKERAKIGGSPCPTGEVRPDDEHLSCDALYCHGSYEYRADQAQSRHLFGSDGPSCYTCHDEEWKDD